MTVNGKLDGRLVQVETVTEGGFANNEGGAVRLSYNMNDENCDDKKSSYSSEGR